MKRTEKPKGEIKAPRVTKTATTKGRPAPVRGTRRVEGRDEVREDAIRLRAYQLYEAAGRRDGHDLEHWLQAERELRGGSRKRL